MFGGLTYLLYIRTIKINNYEKSNYNIITPYTIRWGCPI